MKSRNLLIFSSLCTYLCFLGLILTFKTPICIDSTVVERLDMVTASQVISEKLNWVTESAYKCEARVAVPYSQKLIKTEELVSSKIQKLVSVLESIQKFKKKIHLIVRYDQPLTYQIQNSQLQIGSQLLKAEGHLERGIIKIWIRENLPRQQIEISLFEEVFSDLIYYAIEGDLSIEDPLTGIQTRIGSVQWPQVLKSAEAYCDSSWKSSEHFKICGSLNHPMAEASLKKMMTLSLRPLLSSSLIHSYKRLSFKNQRQLLSRIDQFFQKRELSSDKIIDLISEEPNPLKQGILSIKNFSDIFVSSDLVSRQEFKQLYSGLTSELQNSGFSDSFAEAYFDYMIEIPDHVVPQSAFFKDLELAAKNNLGLQVAIKDQQRIWILPSRTALPLTAFDRIKSRQQIFFACTSLKEIKVDSFFNQTEKLMLIKGCDQNRDYHFAKLFESGIKEFIRKNEKLKFVQFHIPSLEMKQKELAHVSNFFELVENRDVNRQEFRTLGWSQIQWSDEYYAYRPKAEIEAIEFFRN